VARPLAPTEAILIPRDTEEGHQTPVLGMVGGRGGGQHSGSFQAVGLPKRRARLPGAPNKIWGYAPETY